MKSKKELKEEYKQKRFVMGVLQIRNTTSNKIFIDSSVDVNAKWNRHRMQLNFGNHPNAELQKDWRELGETNFEYEILGEIENKEGEIINYNKEVKLLEEMYAEELQPFDEKGYNIKSKTP